MTEPTQPPADRALAVYVHWPFCKAKCPYCDFNSHVRDAVDQDRWRAALLAEIDHYASLTEGRVVTSVFFGGGTPSLMPTDTAAAVIERIRARWDAAPDLEITLEANPTSAEAANFRALRQAGVNRLSLGVQAMNDADLKFLGRQHSVDEALEAVSMARNTMDRFSFDLIYARPGQTEDDWADELTRALALAGDHLSLYQLTIERGTPFFAAHRAGGFVLPDDDASAALFERTQAIMEAAGRPAYEISNHAAPGVESRHNMAYWRGWDYAGIGPGAHGRLTAGGKAIATEATPAPEHWLAAVEARGHGARKSEPLAREDRAAERVMTGLRLTAGIDRAEFASLSGMALEDVIDGAALPRLIDAGYVTSDAATLRATPEGRLRLNAVVAALLG
jgi:putative oxygen-independent coproporphyrinogen III oxidase